MANKSTFVILKPDAIERGLVGRIISRFEDKGFKITQIAMKQQNEQWCILHYAQLPYEVFTRVKDFMLSTPLIGMLLDGPEAPATVKRMVGATNSSNALSGTIRGDFGNYPVHCNLVHASDSMESAVYEANLFFQGRE